MTFSSELVDVEGTQVYLKMGENSTKAPQVGMVTNLAGFKVAAFFENGINKNENGENIYFKNEDDTQNILDELDILSINQSDLQVAPNKDVIVEIDEKAEGATHSDNTELSGRAILSRSFSSFDLGLKIDLNKDSSKQKEINSEKATIITYSTDQKDNIVEETIIEATEEFKYTDDTLDMTFGVDVRKPIGPGNLVVGGGIKPSKRTQEINYSSFDSNFTEDYINDNTSTDSYKYDYEYPTSSYVSPVFVNLKYEYPVKILNKEGIFRISGNFETGSDEDTVKYFTESRSIYKADGSVTSEFINTEEEEYNLSTGLSNYVFAVGTEIDLSTNTIFTIGVKYLYEGTEQVVSSNGYTEKDVNNNYNTDGSLNEGTSYITTTKVSSDYTFTEKTTQNSIVIPYGLETEINSKLTLRLGGTSIIYNSYKEEITEVTEGYHSVTETVYKDGTQLAPVEDNKDGYREEYNETESKFDTYTDFNLGLSYQLNEVATLDMNSGGDLANISYWDVSLNLKF